MKLTTPPEQIVVAEELMLTLGTNIGFTVMVTPFEVTTVGLAQLALDVRTQVTTSPWLRAVVVKVAVLPPTADPFILQL